MKSRVQLIAVQIGVVIGLILLDFSGSGREAVWAAGPAPAAEAPAPAGVNPAAANSAGTKTFEFNGDVIDGGKPGGPKTLNFDGDVIDGQKKSPDLFLQTAGQKMGMDAVIFERSNFNDFHQRDRQQRPAIPEMGSAGRGSKP